MLITNLPTELLLYILSHLPIQDIHILQLTNRIFTDFIQTNEDRIYHHAAMMHHFVPRATSLDEVTLNRHGSNGVASWKELCQRYFILEARWHGEKIPPENGLKVHQFVTLGPIARHFEIDEEEGTIILSIGAGEIQVVSIETVELLWQLTAPRVELHSDLGWSKGFLVFSAPGNCLEVWRRSVDAWDSRKYLPCNPTPDQLAAVSFHAPTSPPTSESSNPGRRGVYVPHTILRTTPRETVFRLVYPELVFASVSARKAYIWDVPTSSLIETINIAPHPSSHRDPATGTFIYSVGISKDHVFICWRGAVVAYPRHQREHVADYGSFSISNRDIIRPTEVPGYFLHELPFFQVSGMWGHPRDQWESPVQTDVQSRGLIPEDISHQWWARTLLDSPFLSSLVSPDGKDLVAVTSSPCWLVYVKDFQSRPETGCDASRCFRLLLSNDRFVKLEFDGRRIVVAFEFSLGFDDRVASILFCITPNDYRRPSEQLDGSRPFSPTIISFESLQGGIRFSSCIRLTDTRVWMSYPREGYQSNNHIPELCLTYVDMDKTENEDIKTENK